MDTLNLLGSAAGLGFLAGIRLYFTVFALGLAVRLGWFGHCWHYQCQGPRRTQPRTRRV